MKQFLQALICICLSCPVFADTWDLRSIANSSNAFTNLQKQDRTSYGVLNVSDAKLVRDIVDRYSLLSGIYPRIFLKDSMELNAAAGYIDGIPILQLYWGMKCRICTFGMVKQERKYKPQAS
jgi:hypothetical protein